MDDMKIRKAFITPSHQALKPLEKYKGNNLDQIYLFGSLYGLAQYTSKNALNAWYFAG